LYKIPANTLFMGQKLIYVPECHSTNSSLAELLAHTDVAEGAVMVTDHQTQGKGQRGNSWESGRQENLTFSVLLKPHFLSTRDQFQLSMAIALGCAAGIAEFVKEKIFLKWPNDLMMGDRKIGGILIENQTQGARLTSSIVGIGINVNQLKFAHLNASSLIQVTGSPHDLNAVFAALLSTLEARYIQLRSGGAEAIRRDYLNHLYRLGVQQSFESEGNRFIGTITGIDESGRLCVNVGSETRKFSLKEIRMT
jgi:BirA family biotin operon repressor/biotin-[acetyl-CoA-carboxylase] ligase